MENENTSGPEGDVLLVPTNMAPLKMVVEGRSLGAAKGGNPASGEDPNPDSGVGAPDTSQPKQAAIFRPLFLAAAERCVEKQAKAVERKAGDVAASFWTAQADYWLTAMTPPAEAYAAALGNPSPAIEVACQIINRACACDADTVAKNGQAPALVARWRSDLAAASADTIMQAIEEDSPHA